MKEIRLEKIDSEKIAKNKKGYREEGTGRSEKMANKRAVGYVRVSTLGQAAEGTYGLEMQKAAIQEYADARGYQIVEWFEEVGSGAKNRPIFDEIAYGSSVGNPPYEAVIVYKSDRVARDMKLYFAYLFALERKGVALVSTIEEFEDEGLANIYRALLQFVAEQERKNISVRTSAGKRQKRQNGGYVGGKIAYGYKVVDADYEVCESEAKVVRRIFSLHDGGESYRGIADRLWEEGCLARNGKPFNHNTIYGIVANRKLYEGMVQYESEWIDGRHEAII